MNLNEKFPITDKKYNEILKKVKYLGIRLEDVKEQFVRGAGKGGQKRNKTSNCVYLEHFPTKISVKYQKYRERSMNRILGLRELLIKIEEKELGNKSDSVVKREKIRKQKARRKRKTKEKY